MFQLIVQQSLSNSHVCAFFQCHETCNIGENICGAKNLRISRKKNSFHWKIYLYQFSLKVGIKSQENKTKKGKSNGNAVLEPHKHVLWICDADRNETKDEINNMNQVFNGTHTENIHTHTRLWFFIQVN